MKTKTIVRATTHHGDTVDPGFPEILDHGVTHRILFTEEGSKSRILLAIDGFTKKSRKTPPRIIKLALRRRDEWRSRGA